MSKPALVFTWRGISTGTVVLVLCLSGAVSPLKAQVINPNWLFAGIVPSADQRLLLDTLLKEAQGQIILDPDSWLKYYLQIRANGLTPPQERSFVQGVLSVLQLEEKVTATGRNSWWKEDLPKIRAVLTPT